MPPVLSAGVIRCYEKLVYLEAGRIRPRLASIVLATYENFLFELCTTGNVQFDSFSVG
jgi:hypothetical protein